MCASTCEEKLTRVEEYIREHAKRRVDLFFYLLVALYQQGFLINKDKTVRQHGVGNGTVTEACHSSLFPNIKLTAQAPVKAKFQSLGNSVVNYLLHASPPLLFKDTHFADVLNMTVELPIAVNKFDLYLEGSISHPSHYVKGCLNILNSVSQGEFDPKIGMDKFFNLMQQFFMDREEKKINQRKTKIKKANKIKVVPSFKINYAELNVPEEKKPEIESIMKSISQLNSAAILKHEREGTFSAAVENSSTHQLEVSSEYLNLMLRRKPKETLATAYQRIQQEIFAPPAVGQQDQKKEQGGRLGLKK